MLVRPVPASSYKVARPSVEQRQQEKSDARATFMEAASEIESAIESIMVAACLVCAVRCALAHLKRTVGASSNNFKFSHSISNNFKFSDSVSNNFKFRGSARNNF